MSNNRVEKLESTVAELESTVEGLTDELIEAKERIRVLEAELDAETPTRVPERRVTAEQEQGEALEEETPEAEPDEVAEAAADADDDDAADEAEDSGSDDIIVA
ncbi:DUF7518 family protein [Natronolimnohabitans innermongolicus]|uniref:Chromosome segregation protein SMC n=1 Tax=Natronolimnohabitans innermongolicus JCM 12255 TaxID=1227499 RepID=L9XHG1_9EURY|nr:hypothetical protein [Natronolimnohabitans innermongolicus]ELY61179.1 hypothetical protein C493_02658 [Natronolimnohabitans innermongolicus JCM 12255]